MDKEKLFDEVYLTYRNYMYKVSLDILHDQYLAEDSVHEAFIKIYRNIDKIKDLKDNNTKRVIQIITKNTAVDIYRKRKKQFGAELDIENANNIGFEDNYNVSDDIFTLAVKSLPDIYSEVLLLKYAAEYNNDEISEILDINPANVRKRLQRGKKMLETSLKNGGIRNAG